MRIRLNLPQSWDFSTDFTVRVGDLNYGAHLGNDRVLTLFHEIRVRWLRSLGWTEMDVVGMGLIQTDAALQYKAQAFLGDMLRGKLALGEINSRGFVLFYQLERMRDAREIARGTTHLLFFDYARQSIASTPDSFAKRFEAKG